MIAEASPATPLGWRTGSVLILWFGLALAANLAGFFHTPPDRMPIPLLIALTGPPLLFGLTYLASEDDRSS